MQRIKVQADPRALREQHYPEIGDQLDAILKGFEHIQNQVSLPKETLDWMKDCQAVKDRFPVEK